MFSRLYRTIRLALKSLMLHRLRSGLTMLGIVFGVFSVIAMVAIGAGASDQAEKQVLQLGATNIIVRSVEPPDQASSPGQSGGFVKRFGLKNEDEQILSTIPDVVRVIPIREVTEKTRYRDREMNARIVGCTSEYLVVNHLELSAGRFLSERDQDQAANVAVIAHEIATDLYRYENPIGKAIRIDQQPFRVIGVTKHRTASAAIGGSLSAQDFNKDVYIPLKTMRTHIDIGNQTIQRQQGSFSARQYDLSQITLEVKGKQDVLPISNVVRESLQIHHADKRDVAVVVPLELLKQAEQLRNIFNIVLGSIAAISLVVGGIGIMNIMLATVTERTREIGVRRALGAKRRDIVYQFLTETIVLSGTGGIAGVLLGLATPKLFVGIRWLVIEKALDTGAANSEMGRMFSQMTPNVELWSVVAAFGISVAIGIVFGLYPAISAARLDPIEALRHE